MNNQNYPYGGGRQQDWYVPYEQPPRKSFIRKIKDILSDRRYRGLIASGTLTGGAVICYVILSNIYGLILGGNETLNELYTGNYMFKLIVEMFYSMICVALPFALCLLIMRSLGEYKEPLPFGKPQGGGTKFFLLILSGLGLCYIGNILSGLFYSYATAAGFEFASYTHALSSPPPVPDNALTAIFMVLHTAVVPALTEEFAFRGVIMQPLRKYGDWFAIIVTGIMFGLVHGNMMQLPFAVIAGIALGYTTIVTGSVWTSVLLHFLNNFISVIYTSVTQVIGGGRALMVSAMTIYGLVFIGIIAFAGYTLENRNFARLRPGDYPRLKKRNTVFFLMPTMVVAVIVMIITTLGDISFRG